MLGRNFLASLDHPHHHREAWLWLYDHQEPYPVDTDIQPYRAPRNVEPRSELAAVNLRPLGRRRGGPVPGYVLELVDESGPRDALIQTDGELAEGFARALLTQRNRGRLLIFAHGEARDFQTILKVFGPALLEAGYQLDIIGTLEHLKGLRIRRSKHVWRLVDAHGVTGVPYSALRRQIRSLGAIAPRFSSPVGRVYKVLDLMQRELQTRFGVVLHETMGQTAVRAAASYLPDSAWCWRPVPLLVSMLRLGGGFRGGHVQSITYRGPAWKMDVRRMYTAALTANLPLRSCFAVWQPSGEYSNGVFMATVSGHGRNPVYISRWQGEDAGFEPCLWFGGEDAVCVLSTEEIAGMMALGYTVLPAYGYAFFRTFTLKAFVAKLQTLTDAYGADSGIGQMAKALGVNVWGKWAQSPHRWDVCFSLARPSDEWSPYTLGLTEIDNCWTRPVTRYRYTQHVELAAVVTAWGRGMLYEQLAQLITDGYAPIKVVTDCIWLKGPPPQAPPTGGQLFGTWRYEGWHPQCVTLRSGAYVWGDVTARPGSSKRDLATIVELYDREAATWQSGSLPLRRWVAAG